MIFRIREVQKLTLLFETLMNLQWRGYHDGYQHFRLDHQDRFGTPPYVRPVVKYCW